MKNLSSRFASVVVGALVALAAKPATATILKQFCGSVSPIHQGWTAAETGCATPGPQGTGEGGVTSWKWKSGPGNCHYEYRLTQEQDILAINNNFYLSTTFKIITPGTGASDVQWSFNPLVDSTNSKLFVLRVNENGGALELTGHPAYNSGLSYTVPDPDMGGPLKPNDVHHTYVIKYDKLLGVAKVFVDGVDVLWTLTPFPSTGSVAEMNGEDWDTEISWSHYELGYSESFGSSWKNPANSIESWHLGSSWTSDTGPVVPNAVGAIATFNDYPTVNLVGGGSFIRTFEPVTVGTLIYRSVHGVGISGGLTEDRHTPAITFDALGSGPATIEHRCSSSGAQIDNDIILNDNLVVKVADPGNSVTFWQNTVTTNGYTLTHQGPGGLFFSKNFRGPHLNIQNGAVEIHPKGLPLPGFGSGPNDPNGTSIVQTLTLVPGGSSGSTFSAFNNNLIINYADPSPYEQIRAAVKLGFYDLGLQYGQGSIKSEWCKYVWTSSTSKTCETGLILCGSSPWGMNCLGIQEETPGSGIRKVPKNPTILAVIDNAHKSPRYQQWCGHSVGLNSIVTQYTYLGDVDLNGKVEPADLTIVNGSIATPPMGTHRWFHGDVNYDGVVNTADQSIVNGNIGAGNGTSGGAAITPCTYAY
jgi:hypothetical protein